MTSKRQLVVAPLPGFQPEIGRWMSALEEIRRRLKLDISDLSPAVADWVTTYRVNSIGTLLYHIAITEIDWLYKVLESSRPEEIQSILPWPARTTAGTLTPVIGMSMREHIHRLDLTRSHLLEHFRGMDLTRFHRKYDRADFDITPEWVLPHLLNHEARHWGQILSIKSEAKRAGVDKA